MGEREKETNYPRGNEIICQFKRKICKTQQLQINMIVLFIQPRSDWCKDGRDYLDSKIIGHSTIRSSTTAEIVDDKSSKASPIFTKDTDDGNTPTKCSHPHRVDTTAILEKVSLFHQHRHARGRDATTGSLHRTLSIHATTTEQTYMVEECDENDYHLDLDSYKPVGRLPIDHGVTLFPVAAPNNGMDLHLLQVRYISIPFHFNPTPRKIQPRRVKKPY